MDNIFIERLWRSLKYEAVYLHDLADGFQARRVIGEWIDFYNAERPHSALGGKTPAEAYRSDPPADMMDKPLRALPIYPQAQQRRQEDRSKETLARSAATGIHLKQAAKLSTNRGHLKAYPMIARMGHESKASRFQTDPLPTILWRAAFK